MAGVFISYRRDDSAGFAGRLADDLGEAFGSELVFMDVTGIAPGIDFRKAIEGKVGDCDAALVVIGKAWLGGRAADGTTRLQDATDFVRLEVAAALRRDVPVIPVLVDGAAMPSARDLPADLEPLAWRNAVELRHSRWDADLQVLVQALEKLLPRKGTAPVGADRAPATRSRRVPWATAAVAALAVIIVALLATRPWNARPGIEPPSQGDGGGSTGGDVKPGRVGGGGNAAAPVALRASADVTVGSARVQILSAQLEQPNASQMVLRLKMRMTALQPSPANFWNAMFRLLVDGVPAAPSNTLNEVVEGYAAKDGELAFEIGPAVSNVVLEVKYGAESTRIPIDLKSTAPGTHAAASRRKLAGPFPMALPVGTEVRAGTVTYRVLSAAIGRRNMEQLELKLLVRASNHGPTPVNFWDASFRLEVDGVPRAPTSGLSEVVESNSAGQGEVVFPFDDTAETLVLLIGHGKDKTRVPVDLTR
jgi:hypothetical protein